MNRTAPPATIVVLGGTGDLMRRKLLPALYHLTVQGLLHERTRILGAARSRELDDDRFRAWGRQALEEAGLLADEAASRWCDRCLFYASMGEGKAADYAALARRIEALERAQDSPANHIFDLALPPQAFPAAIRGLGEAGLSRSDGWTRLVVEKPFGHDLDSSRELNRLVHGYFDEAQVYRIDHYLGKETVQNLLAFRFANPIFEALWNRDRVEHVQVTVAEEVGIEDRAGYYDAAGALRDMVQNHLTQLLALVAMEVPGSLEADSIRNEKVKVLRAIPAVRSDDVVRGQYTAGTIGEQGVPAYREELGVAQDSTTETYVALRLEVANWRWHGVPFYLRAGKRLPRRLTQIAVVFRRPPVSLFPTVAESGAIRPNVLTITIQPDEGFALGFEVKAPGAPLALRTQRLNFRYAEAFAPLPDAYETLLMDVLLGDQTLFVRADEVEASWRLYTPLLGNHVVEPYAAGSWGPPGARALMVRSGREWLPA